jgi:hypothetical protein
MQASRPLASGAAAADSTSSSYGRGSFPPVTRATVTSDTPPKMVVPQVGGERPGLRSVGRGGVADFRVRARRISQPEWFCDGIRVYTYSTEIQSDNSRLVDRNMCIHTCERFIHTS